MSKAKELADKAYLEGDMFVFGDATIVCRLAYQKGYNQAEKDNTLTWEDISIIRKIMYDYNKQVRNEMVIPKEEEYCKEVLKRFLEQKGE